MCCAPRASSGEEGVLGLGITVAPATTAGILREDIHLTLRNGESILPATRLSYQKIREKKKGKGGLVLMVIVRR